MNTINPREDMFADFFQVDNSLSEVLKAFPTAEGFGKNATGGRGYPVYFVTNLNSSGAGSFRQAVLDVNSNNGGNILFTVGGNINLAGDLDLLGGNCRIAGQTATGDGIAITGGMFHIRSSNVVIQYIRFRGDNVNLPTKDALQITAFGGETIENIVIDHCSLSWAGDESFNVRGVGSGVVRNVTLQNCIVSESLYGCLIGGDPNLGSVENITIINCLFANNQERNIRAQTNVNNPFIFEMINNLIYGWQWGTSPSLGTKFSVINNIYKESSQVSRSGACVDGTTAGQVNPAETHAHLEGNITNGIPLNNATISPYLEANAFATSNSTILPANTIEALILPTVGCSLPNRDSVDTRIVQQYNNGNGTLAYNGTPPALSNGTPPIDSNNDGIPDLWESINMPQGATAIDYAPSGYTWLEEYINTIDSVDPTLSVPSNTIQNNFKIYPISLRMPFPTLTNKGKSVPSYKNYKEIYDRLKREGGYTDSELNAFFDEFKRQKGDFMNAMDFYEFVNQSMSTQTTKTQFIDPPKVEPDVVDVSDIDFSEPPKKELSFLTIGLGVVVLVGITNLLVRKK